MSRTWRNILAGLPATRPMSKPNVKFSDLSLDVMCVNCHEMIKFEHLEEHSHFCT